MYLFPKYVIIAELTTIIAAQTQFQEVGHVNILTHQTHADTPTFAGHMVFVLILLEVVAFGLMLGLMSVVSTYLEQYNADKDHIMKANAAFIAIFLTIKVTTQLILILHYQGTLLTGSEPLQIIQFCNNISIICFYLACGLNFYKWLVIINRAYLFSGNFSQWRFKFQNNLNMWLFIFMCLAGGGTNLAFMTVDLIKNQDTQQNAFENLLGIGKSNNIIITVILSLCVISLCAIGGFLVNRLRTFFKENYFQHSKTIIASVILMGLGSLAMLAQNELRMYKQDWLDSIQVESRENQNWHFPMVYLLMILLGEYFPIFAQIACIKLSIIGNWNELTQSDLTPPDETLSLHSNMFLEFRNQLIQDSIFAHRLSISEQQSLERAHSIKINKSSLLTDTQRDSMLENRKSVDAALFKVLSSQILPQVEHDVSQFYAPIQALPTGTFVDLEQSSRVGSIFENQEDSIEQTSFLSENLFA